jgi:hypothetical protein
MGPEPKMNRSLAQGLASGDTVFGIVGENRTFNNISARAVYSCREDAEAHLRDPERMWFDDRAVVIPLMLDKPLNLK